MLTTDRNRDMETTLSIVERNALEQLEEVIERGLASFVEVGKALILINEQRLYRSEYATFEEYCRDRWGFSRTHAYRQMSASRVAEILSPIGDTPRESVLRELTPLVDDPEAVIEAWNTATETEAKPTASEVRQVVRIVHAPTALRRLRDFNAHMDKAFDFTQRAKEQEQLAWVALREAVIEGVDAEQIAANTGFDLAQAEEFVRSCQVVPA